jgi:hypothetical protein
MNIEWESVWSEAEVMTADNMTQIQTGQLLK